MQKLAQFFRDRLDLIVLLACLIFTYMIWSYGLKNDTTEYDSVVDVAHDIEVVMTEEVENIFAFIDGVRGLYVASENIDDTELSAYMSATSQNHLSDAVLRINYIEKVPNKEIEDKSQVVEGYDHQFIVKTVVDKDGELYAPSAFNLLQDDERRVVIDKILQGQQTGAAVVSSIKGVPVYDRGGFVMLVPIEKDGELIGFVDALVSTEKMNEILSEMVDEEWGYKWSQSGKEINKREMENPINVLSVVSEIPVGESDTWQIEVIKNKTVNILWTIVLGSGVVLSFLIYIVVYALNSASQRGLEMGRAMTKDLQKFKLALDSASNHIVITDPEGVILYANKAVSDLTGYTNQEIVGQTPRLWGRQMPSDFYIRFWDQIKNKKKIFVGTFKNKRKDGQDYLAVATVSPIIDEEGNLVGFVGVEEDVTAERKAATENAENLAKLAKFNELMVGRELKMVELKKELAKMKGDNEK